MRLASSSRKVLKSGFVILLSFQWNRNKSNKTHSYIHSVTLIHSLFFSLSHVSPVRRFKWEKKKSGFFELNPNESNTWNSYLDISAKHFPCENMRKMISKQIEAMFEAAQIAQTKYIFFLASHPVWQTYFTVTVTVSMAHIFLTFLFTEFVGFKNIGNRNR